MSRLEAGIFNEGFDSLPHLASPSFFYINDDSSWMDNRRTENKRFTESWIELDRAYSCGSSTSYDKKCFSSSSTSSSSGCCCRTGCCYSICCSCSRFIRILVYLLIAISVIGFAAIISGILYMEIFHKFDEPYFKLTNETTFLDNRANFNFSSTRFIPSTIPTTTATTEAMSSTSVPFQDVSNKGMVQVLNTTSPPTTTSRGPSSVTISRNPSTETTTFPFTVPSSTIMSLNDTGSESATLEEKGNPTTELKNSSVVTIAETSVSTLTTLQPATSVSPKPTRDWSQRNPPTTLAVSTTTIDPTTTIPPNRPQ